MSDRGNTPEYWNRVWTKFRNADKTYVLKAMADRANTKEYWDQMWSRPSRRTEKYTMQYCWWKIEELKPKSILDAGCGNGRLLSPLKDKMDCFGIDISQVAINRLKAEYGVDGKAMDVYDLGDLDMSFDFIAANHLLEHLYRDEFFVRLCYDKLNPGGTLFAGVPNDMSGPEETEEHVRKYNKQSITELFTKVFGNCKIKIIGNHLIAMGTKSTQEEQVIEKLHLGCGIKAMKGYHNIDVEEHPGVDQIADFRDLHFKGLKEIRSHHLFEHFSREEALVILDKWHDWLDQNGVLIIETPDFEGICKDFDKDNYWMTRHAYGSQESDWAFHKDGWYEAKYREILPKHGFEITDIRKSHSRKILPNITVTAKKK